MLDDNSSCEIVNRKIKLPTENELQKNFNGTLHFLWRYTAKFSEPLARVVILLMTFVMSHKSRVWCYF